MPEVQHTFLVPAVLHPQVKYGWTPGAGRGPNLAPAAERAKAATLADWGERIDHAAAYGADALHAPDSPSQARLP